MRHTAKERFLRYVTIDTQSDPNSPTCPSTEKQKNLSRLLVEELKAMGIADAELDDDGYVYATIPANTDKKVPVLCFCSHVDTSPDCSGAGVGLCTADPDCTRTPGLPQARRCGRRRHADEVLCARPEGR